MAGVKIADQPVVSENLTSLRIQFIIFVRGGHVHRTSQLVDS